MMDSRAGKILHYTNSTHNSTCKQGQGNTGGGPYRLEYTHAREHTYAQIICSMLVPRVPCLKPMSAIMPLPRPLSSDILRKPLLLAVACINKKGGWVVALGIHQISR